MAELAVCSDSTVLPRTGRLIQLQNLPQNHIDDLHTARLFVRHSDFSAIEARVIAWLANESWHMDVFVNGGDIYCASASEMFNVPVEKHGVNVLKAFGADKLGLSDSDMDSIIKKWRDSNPNICKLWRDFEAAAFHAIKLKSSTVCQKDISFQAVDDFLFVNLPSVRKLAYFKPRIIKKDGKESLAYFGNIQTSGG